MMSSPTRSAAATSSSGEASPSPRSEWIWRSALPTKSPSAVPDRLEHRPLVGHRTDLAFEDRREAPDPVADVGGVVVGPAKVQLWLEDRADRAALAPREGRDHRRAGPQRERDVRRRQQRLAPEERDALAHAGDRAVGQDAEHAALPEHAPDAQRRVGLHEAEAHRGASPVDRARELARLAFDRQRGRVTVQDEDLPAHRDRAEVRARDDDPASAGVRGDELIPSDHPDLAQHLPRVEPGQPEDLEVVTDLRDERRADQALAVATFRRDDAEVRADGRPRARGEPVRERPRDRRDHGVGRGGEQRDGPLGRSNGDRGEPAHAPAAARRGHIGRKMYHWSGQRRTKCSSPRAIASVACCTSSVACRVRSTKIGGSAIPVNVLSWRRTTAATTMGAPETRARFAATAGNAVGVPKKSASTVSSACARGPMSIIRPTISLRRNAPSTFFAAPSGASRVMFLCARLPTSRSIKRWFSSSSAMTFRGISSAIRAPPSSKLPKWMDTKIRPLPLASAPRRCSQPSTVTSRSKSEMSRRGKRMISTTYLAKLRNDRRAPRATSRSVDGRARTMAKLCFAISRFARQPR